MSKFAITRGLYHIIQCINENHYPNKKELITYLERKDIRVSMRTLDRYFETIRSDLGLEIVYSKKERGYFIDEEQSVRVPSFFKFLELVEVADILSDSLIDSSKIIDFVHFDDSKDFMGIDNLKNVLLAIKEKRTINFNHVNYEANTEKEYTVIPLILKEYINRWYVVCAYKKSEIRTFGIDRILNLKLGEVSKIKRADYQERLDKFKHTIGLYYGEGEPVKITLLVDSIHVKYLRSLPLHHSQLIYPADKNNNHKVEYLVYPNYEFITQVLKMGDRAEVISPPEVRNEVKAYLKSSLRKYN